MEEEYDITYDYKKGFNQGYLIGKYEPDLGASLDKVELQSNRIKGIKAGLLQVGKEKSLSNLPKWMQDHENSKDKKENEKDIDLDRE